MNGKYQVGSGRIVAIAHDTPFITNSILDSDEKINPQDENFFKYIPDEFLTEEQRMAKRNQEAITADNFEHVIWTAS